MNRNVLAAEISVAGINVGMVDRETHFVIPGSCLFEAVDTLDTAGILLAAGPPLSGNAQI